MTFKVTKEAYSKFEECGLSKENFIRVGVIAGGCKGYSYDLQIEDEKLDSDIILTERVITHQSNENYVDGVSIDYSDDLIAPGFRVVNKKAKSSCGCGSSYELPEAPCKQ